MLVVGVASGVLLLGRLPAGVRGSGITIGLIGTGVALLSWLLAVLVLRRVLAAPARSGSDLEPPGTTPSAPSGCVRSPT